MMPLIVDANVVSEVFPAPAGGDFEPVWEAIRSQRAVAVYGGQLAVEYTAVTRVIPLLLELGRSGAVRRVPDRDMEQHSIAVRASGLCQSNDAHIIGLARASGARLLCSRDQHLHTDFTSPQLLQPSGHVYQSPQHKHLLRRYGA